MTDLQAALGVSQMNRLDDYVTKRHQLAKRYNELFEKFPLTRPWQHPDTYSSLHLYIIRLHLDSIEGTHRQVFENLRKRGIGVNIHYIPLYDQPIYRGSNISSDDFPNSEAYYEEAISLPLYPTLRTDEQDQVINAVSRALAL
jgi:dTDP-4-amino-4,6-dideoxygalactose transaminase